MSGLLSAVTPAPNVPCGMQASDRQIAAGPGDVEITEANLDQVVARAGKAMGLKIHPSPYPGEGGKPAFVEEFVKQEGGEGHLGRIPMHVIEQSAEALIREVDHEQPDAPDTCGKFIQFLSDCESFALDVQARDRRGLTSIGLKTLAMFWVLFPHGKPARQVCADFGIDHQKFSAYAAEFSRRIGGHRNIFQMSHGRRGQSNDGGDDGDS